MSNLQKLGLVIGFIVMISCHQVLRTIQYEKYIEGAQFDTSYYVGNVGLTPHASESIKQSMLASSNTEMSVKPDSFNVSVKPITAEQSGPTKHSSAITLEPLSSSTFRITVDPNSTISKDISMIWHDVEKGLICVHLKEDSKCPHPALLGRLSGPALAILDWEDHTTESKNGTVQCGDYSNKWLDVGEYFVEIIILYCEDFGIGALQRLNNETAWLKTDFKKKCPEDSMYNRITSKEGSWINITSPREGKGNYHLGRWVRREGIPSRPLFTRHQPVACSDPKKQYKGLHPLPKWCETFVRRDNPNTGKSLWVSRKGAALIGLPEYEFQWRLNATEEELVGRLRKRLHHTSKQLPKICGIGDSHSRMMEQRSLRQLNLTGIFEFIQSYWIAPRAIAHKVVRAKCDKLFVQIGQWAPSWYTRGKPFSFQKYHRQMKKHVENALRVLESNTDAKIFLPTIDQGPLTARVNACNDWRTPTVQDGYSKVLQIIERELNTSRVEYIDTNFIIYTPYDGHGDWTHLLEDVRYRKTIYILALILGELDGLGDS